MNVLDMLSKEIQNKNWTTEEKARYLYIRSCQLFSYDERYNFTDLDACQRFCFSKIVDRKIDLEDVTDNRVICKSYSREVLSKILLELLGIECIETGKAHAWNIFNDKKRDIDADATVSSDLARVKMGLTTKGYNPVMREYGFEDELKKYDKEIGYIKDEYENYFLENKIKQILEECLNIDSQDEVLINKLYSIKELFENYKLESFSDSEFCISYIMRKVLQDNIVKKASLFNSIINDYWDFINIYPFKLENQYIYFILRKIDDRNCFYEISENDAKEYVKTLPGLSKHIILNQ